MTDDIVTRLEREIELSDTCICNWMLEDAADEIKRLRAAGDALAAAYLDIWQCRGIGAGTIQRTYDAWLEARRD